MGKKNKQVADAVLESAKEKQDIPPKVEELFAKEVAALKVVHPEPDTQEVTTEVVSEPALDGTTDDVRAPLVIPPVVKDTKPRIDWGKRIMDGIGNGAIVVDKWLDAAWDMAKQLPGALWSFVSLIGLMVLAVIGIVCYGIGRLVGFIIKTLNMGYRGDNLWGPKPVIPVN